jgi:hypothetical protein
MLKKSAKLQCGKPLEFGLVVVAVQVRNVLAVHDQRVVDPAAEDVLRLQRIRTACLAGRQVVFRDDVVTIVDITS